MIHGMTRVKYYAFTFALYGCLFGFGVLVNHGRMQWWALWFYLGVFLLIAGIGEWTHWRRAKRAVAFTPRDSKDAE